MTEPSKGRASNGASSIYRGKDGDWHGRVTMGARDDGRPDRRHVRAKTRAARRSASSGWRWRWDLNPRKLSLHTLSRSETARPDGAAGRRLAPGRRLTHRGAPCRTPANETRTETTRVLTTIRARSLGGQSQHAFQVCRPPSAAVHPVCLAGQPSGSGPTWPQTETNDTTTEPDRVAEPSVGTLAGHALDDTRLRPETGG